MAPKYKLTYFPFQALGETIRLLLTYMGEDFDDSKCNIEDWPKMKASRLGNKRRVGRLVLIMAPKNKFTYFPLKALGEPIRLLFVYIGEDYEDNRVEIEDWPKMKPTTKWGKLPVLETDGKTVTQHLAICRYLAKKAGLNGKDDWEDLKIDEIIYVINDLRTELVKYSYEKDEKIKEAVKGPLLKDIVPFYMKKLDAGVKENNGYLANGKLSWADLYFAGVCDYFSYMHGSEITTSYPNMKELRERVENLPRIKEWVSKRPKTDF